MFTWIWLKTQIGMKYSVYYCITSNLFLLMIVLPCVVLEIAKFVVYVQTYIALYLLAML